MRIVRSILAVVAGFLFIAVTSTAMDFAMEKTLLPGLTTANVSTAAWIFVTLYRAVFSILGCAIAARLAPARPMVHALTLGILGIAFSTLGLIVMWGVGPLWYPVALIMISLPCAWLGGRLQSALSG